MHPRKDQEKLGASLVSVAVLSCIVAWGMGWFTTRTQDASPAPPAVIAPPAVEVSRLAVRDG